MFWHANKHANEAETGLKLFQAVWVFCFSFSSDCATGQKLMKWSTFYIKPCWKGRRRFVGISQRRLILRNLQRCGYDMSSRFDTVPERVFHRQTDRHYKYRALHYTEQTRTSDKKTNGWTTKYGYFTKEVALHPCLPDSPKPVSPKPDSPKLGFRVRVRVSVSANRVSANRDW